MVRSGIKGCRGQKFLWGRSQLVILALPSHLSRPFWTNFWALYNVDLRSFLLFFVVVVVLLRLLVLVVCLRSTIQLSAQPTLSH
eukprot:2266685-Amphidinium_carterae.1